MKKLLSIALAAALALSMTACGGDAKETTAAPAETTTAAAADTTAAAEETTAAPAEAEYQWTIGTSATDASAIGQTMQYLADIMAEKSGGRIQVTCYPNSQLGSDAELVEGAQMGSVTMVIGNTAPQVAFVPALALFDLPNVYDSIDTAQTVLASFTEKMGPSFEGTDLHLGQIFPTVFRTMSCSKEIRSIDDFDGIKIRTMTNEFHMAYWNELGATATPVDFSELYIGLQQGLVDAQENPVDIFLSSKFNEQQAYLIHTKHIAFVATILMNQATYDALPDDLKAVVDECFAEAGAYGTKIAQEAEAGNLAKAEELGVTIIELDDATIAAMVEKAQPVYDSIREAVGTELVDEYMAAIDAASK